MKVFSLLIYIDSIDIVKFHIDNMVTKISYSMYDQYG